MQKAPVHRVRYGRISAAIWENQGEHGPFHTVRLSKSFREDEQFRETSSLGKEDLLTASKALVEAHTWIFSHEGVKEETPAADIGS